jgi:Mrp family chromosome partitioning ATPase
MLELDGSAMGEGDTIPDRLGSIYTFYSYKGGVGRSMALVNVGILMALEGHKVLLVAWDLEAPALRRFLFDPEPAHLTDCLPLRRVFWICWRRALKQNRFPGKIAF